MNIGKLPLEIQKIIINYLIELKMSKKSRYFNNIHTELLYGYWIKKNDDGIYAYTHYYNPIKIMRDDQIASIINNSKEYTPFLNLSTPDENKWSYPNMMEYEYATRIPRLI